jgi:hypothetical protein
MVMAILKGQIASKTINIKDPFSLKRAKQA